MARVLIIGCGCRGRALALELVARGHVVRGTTRDPATLPLIEAAGAEAVLADPDRLMTVLPALAQTAAVVLLLANASGPPEQVRALHEERLEALLRMVLDTTVRGVVYEAAGTAPAGLLHAGAGTVARHCERSRIPFGVIGAEPGAGWPSEPAGAVERLLSAGEAAASRPDDHGP